MSEMVVGIDLGTSNSVISVVLEGQPIVIPDREGNLIHPSVVHFFEDGRTVVGQPANPYRVNDPAHTVYSAKRLIGRPYDSPELKVIIGSFPYPVVASGDGAPRIQIYNQLHPPEGISARVLYYLKELAQQYLGEEVKKAVITVPANFDEGQRRATKRAGELAGLEVLRLINEPTAASLAYGHGQDRRERVAIYDFGGGTFDVTILQLRGNVFEVLSTAGNSYLGGDDFDHRLVSSMLNAFEKQYGYDLSGDEIIRQRLKAIAQDIKHQLSTEEVVTARVTEYAPGTLTELELEFSLTRDTFDRRCADIIDQSLQTCQEALQLSGLRTGEIDHLVLVGGTTRVPAVARRVQEFFGQRAVAGVNPDEVVSVGAAIFGESITRQIQAPAPSTFPHMGSDDDSWLEALDEEPGGPSGTNPGVPTGAYDPELATQALEQHGQQQPPPVPQQKQQRQQKQQKQQVAAPLLIDVTPHALGVATVGGVMDIIIERNGALPLQRTRYFSTARDDQTRVVLPIYAGNSRRIEDNGQLGVLELTEIPPGPREDVQIEVTFEVDTSGMLSIRATDMRTGLNQVARLNIAGQAEIDETYYDASDLMMS